MRYTPWCLPVILLLAIAARAHERPALINVSSPEEHAVDGGRWYSVLKRTGSPWACGSRQEAAQCVEHALVVDNQSPQTLECMAGFAYQTSDGTRVNDPDMPALVLPRTSHEIRGRITAEATSIQVDRLECRARPPYQRLRKSADCTYQMSGNPLEDYYPPAAIRLALEGPVTVSFLLSKRSGPPSEVTVVDSSQVQMLDEAAKRFVSEQRFNTGCAGTRFDVRVRFTLRDRYLEPPTG
jgi:TonB family protein